jgi:hypothetical protein
VVRWVCVFVHRFLSELKKRLLAEKICYCKYFGEFTSIATHILSVVGKIRFKNSVCLLEQESI